jgi:hypothetical protein
LSPDSVAVGAWRTKNIAELDRNLEVLKAIRDSSESRDRDKIDATLAIGRHLGVVAADGRSKGPTGLDTEKPKHQKQMRDELDDYLDGLDTRNSLP